MPLTVLRKPTAYVRGTTRKKSRTTSKPRPARILRNDEEAIAAAHEAAAIFRATASERDRRRTLPYREVDLLSEIGLYGATVPKEFGGAEITAVTLAEVFRIISAADPSLGQIPQNHVAFVETIREGTRTQQEFYFRRFLKGERIGNALSEANNKKGMKDYKTRLTKVKGAYRINGEKAYCTGAIFAHWIPVFTLDEQDRLWMAYVRSDSPGITIHDNWSGMGQRTTASGTITFENVYATEHELIPRFGQTQPQVGHAWGQIPHAAIDLGIAEEAFADTLHFIKTRSRPWHGSGLDKLSDEPLVIQKIGEFQHAINAARLLLKHGAELTDIARANTTDETSLAASIAVAEARIATDHASLLVTNGLFELCGTKSTFTEHNLDRHWRNARTHTLHDPIRWKTQFIGNYILNDVRPPKNALF